MPAAWKANQSPVAPDPVCTSSTIMSAPWRRGEFAHAGQISRVRLDHAGLALDRFQGQRLPRRAERGLQSVEVVIRDVSHARQQRLEGFPVRGSR